MSRSYRGTTKRDRFQSDWRMARNDKTLIVEVKHGRGNTGSHSDSGSLGSGLDILPYEAGSTTNDPDAGVGIRCNDSNGTGLDCDRSEEEWV